MNPTLAAHDHGAFSSWGWVEWSIFVACCLATVWVLWLAVRWTLRPGEEEPDHVKRSILDDETPPDATPKPPTPR